MSRLGQRIKSLFGSKRPKPAAAPSSPIPSVRTTLGAAAIDRERKLRELRPRTSVRDAVIVRETGDSGFGLGTGMLLGMAMSSHSHGDARYGHPEVDAQGGSDFDGGGGGASGGAGASGGWDSGSSSDGGSSSSCDSGSGGGGREG